MAPLSYDYMAGPRSRQEKGGPDPFFKFPFGLRRISKTVRVMKNVVKVAEI